MQYVVAYHHDEIIRTYYLLVTVLQKEDVQLKLGSEAASSSEEQLSESELIGIDELQLLLQAMQFRRYSM